MPQELDPSAILQLAFGYWPSKTLLSAVELELFTQLGAEAMTGEEIGDGSGLHAARDLRLPRRARRAAASSSATATAPTARYRNTPETRGLPRQAAARPTSAASSRWPTRGCTASGATSPRRCGPASRRTRSSTPAQPMFEELYSDPARLEQFMNAMAGISLGNFQALAEKFDFSQLRDALRRRRRDRPALDRSSPRATRTCAARASTCRSSSRSPRRHDRGGRADATA